MQSHDIIIIGGGAAGLTAAAGMAQLGMKCALVEREHMGGDCLYFGCVPSKTLLKSAKVQHLIETAQYYGLPKQTLVPGNASDIMQHIQRVIADLAPHDSPERFTEMGVEVFLQAGRFRSATEIALEDGKVLSAPNIIIATGSSPRIPPIAGIDTISYLTNRDIFSLQQFPKSLITLGGGPIGVELSQALARFGVQVTIINAATHILPREDEDMAALIREQLEADGVEVICDAEIVSVAESESMHKTVTYTRDGQSHEISAEELLVALGRTGNIASLDLAVAGIRSEDGYIPVDAKLRTSRKNILAIGDVNGNFLFTHTAGAEGSFAVKTLALHLPGNFSYNHIPWTTYTDPEFASVGLNEKRAQKAGISYTVHMTEIGEIDRANAERETAGRIKVLLDPKERVLGTQIVSAHAGELITPSLFAVRGKWKFSRMMGPVYPYPTFGEIHKKSAGSYAAPKLFNERVRKYLRFLFHYRGATG